MRSDDGERLLGLYSALSDESRYLRFLSASAPPHARDLERIDEIDYDRKFALVAELGDDIVAAAEYVRSDDLSEAEVAFAVADAHHGRGLGTIMLEHLAAIAHEAGIRRFVAVTAATNGRMLRVFEDAGFTMRETRDGSTVDVTLDLEPTVASISAQDDREHRAEARSMRRLLAPTSIAVIGASRRHETIGHAVLRNLLDSGFHGPVYPVNPNATSIAGVAAYPTVRAVPDPVDLAIVCVPAEHVPTVLDDCIAKKVHGVVVISAGFGEAGAAGAQAERELIARARANGLRVIGPNCMGVVNTRVGVSMNATFAPFPPNPGSFGFASQSGGVGIALLARAAEQGLGISTFVSLGNRADVSSNDLLQYWEEDDDTDVIMLYLESFGNPAKFARLARRIARTKPIVAVKSGRTAAGARGTASHTAALAIPDVAVDALFTQAGVIRVDTLEELFDTAVVLHHQPLPRGRRVAIVTNGGGPAILAADAAVAAGLEVAELSDETQATLRRVVSAEASVSNPVDLVASAGAETYERALDVLLVDPAVDAVLAIFVPPMVTRADDVAAAICAAGGRVTDKPLLACFLGRSGSIEVLGKVGPTGSSGTARIPSFAFPEQPAMVLARAATLAEWRHRPEGTVPSLTDAHVEVARAIAADWLARHPRGEWLDAATAVRLVDAIGIPVVPTRVTSDEDGAVSAAQEIGFPVALKAGSPSIVHKTERGAVQLDLADAEAVRGAFRAMHDVLGEQMGGAVVQSMVEPGVETIIGMTRDPSFGPLVLFGMGGVQAELLRDTCLRIVPVTDRDAADMVRSLRGSPLLFGYRGAPSANTDAIEDALIRVGLLAEHVPEIAELDCNPLVASASGASVVDVKIRLVPVERRPAASIRRLPA